MTSESMACIDLPRAGGSYALELTLSQSARLQVGKLGVFDFPAGDYIYTGSAFGSGGLHARVNRHLSPPSTHKLHWHIDYLRQVASPCALILFSHEPERDVETRLECLWSQLFQRMPESSLPAFGFGASDCAAGCGAHLIMFQAPILQPLLAEAAVRRRIAASAGVQTDLLRFYTLLVK